MLENLLCEVKKIESAVGYEIVAPAHKIEIDRLKDWTFSHIKNDLWFSEYEDFLKLRNGLDFDGFIIYCTNPEDENNDFIIANSVWRNEYKENGNYLFFGESGISWFVFDITLERFVELDKPSGDFIKSYDSFNHMLINILKRAIG
ncbi:SMI1 / KNR4 family protein [Sporolactobacillus shoreae]|uniref:SMI1 / KNR4 family protein n=1 Tax=Sporolactobacillus shoreae TaxID=1465501 RepID=A0A4Z0GKB4_9BACL|nr:YrhA family protein [Sporolactobacillus shoreae]TGA96122.1 SMI1 / KNR4 family protein [Sporolactobacillus shoreae]